MRKIKRIVFVIFRVILSFIEHFSSNSYMKLYTLLLRKMGISLNGTPRYISPTAHFDGVDMSLISLGNNVVISKNVEFLTHDFSIARGLESIDKKLADKGKDEFFLKHIRVGDNCFIGMHSIIMPGTVLGNNVIVGAGTVVRGNVPDDTIIMGNPSVKIGNTKEWAMKKLEKKEDIHCE